MGQIQLQIATAHTCLAIGRAFAATCYKSNGQDRKLCRQNLWFQWLAVNKQLYEHTEEQKQNKPALVRFAQDLIHCVSVQACVTQYAKRDRLQPLYKARECFLTT